MNVLVLLAGSSVAFKDAAIPSRSRSSRSPDSRSSGMLSRSSGHSCEPVRG